MTSSGSLTTWTSTSVGVGADSTRSVEITGRRAEGGGGTGGRRDVAGAGQVGDQLEGAGKVVRGEQVRGAAGDGEGDRVGLRGCASAAGLRAASVVATSA